MNDTATLHVRLDRPSSNPLCKIREDILSARLNGKAVTEIRMDEKSWKELDNWIRSHDLFRIRTGKDQESMCGTFDGIPIVVEKDMVDNHR